MKKLWATDVEFRVTVVSVGDNSREAEQNVKDDIDGIWSDYNYLYADVCSSIIKEEKDLPSDWRDQLPHGEDDEVCEIIMEAIEEERKRKELEAERDKNQLKLELGDE